jgi:hypothetical protein
MNAERVFRILWISLAIGLNLMAILALILGGALLFGSGGAVRDIAAIAVCLTIPVANLVALGLKHSANSRAIRFSTVILWVNRAGIGLGAIFGIASAVELTYSGQEIMATLALTIPPAVTSLALSKHRNRAPQRADTD